VLRVESSNEQRAECKSRCLTLKNMKLDITTLDQGDLALLQRGLAQTGFYNGTFLGKGGPKTLAAYNAYRESLNPGSIVAKSMIDRFVEILVAEDGVREIPQNSNRGPRVEEYQRATWLDGTGWPWCAAFVCWGLMKLEAEFDFPFARPQTGGAWDFENWAKQQGLVLMKPPGKILKGDIVIFTFSHIGVAREDESNGQVPTIEGNTDSGGSREGNGAYKRTRAKSLIRSVIRLEKK
jgi:hypothetical protein